MVAPPFGDTGGPEIVTQILTDELLKIGVDVTLFAPADWKTEAKHIPTLKKSLWNMDDFSKHDKITRRNLIISSQVKVLNYQKSFDLIHLHSQRYAYVIAKNSNLPCVLSFHNIINKQLFNQIKETGTYTVALSKYQKGNLKTDAVIRNGVPVSNIDYSLKRGRYLIAIGRIADQKGIDTAIKISKKAGKRILFFGRTGNSNERQFYFKNKIEPFIDNKSVIYKKQVTHEKIYTYLKNAEALLFPIKRPEVCPMVIAESLACGTPVISTNINPLPELLTNKHVAFLSNNLLDLVSAAKNTDMFNRKECRNYALKNLDSQLMATKYLKLYQKILSRSQK